MRQETGRCPLKRFEAPRFKNSLTKSRKEKEAGPRDNEKPTGKKKRAGVKNEMVNSTRSQKINFSEEGAKFLEV